jgi:hypothetical protein
MVKSLEQVLQNINRLNRNLEGVIAVSPLLPFLYLILFFALYFRDMGMVIFVEKKDGGNADADADADVCVAMYVL